MDVASASRAARVTVTNGHVQDVRVYLVRGGMRYRMGNLTTGERRTFTVPEWVIAASGGFQLQVDLLGDATLFTSDRIPASAGDHVEWFVAPRLSMSWFRVQAGGDVGGRE